jgi:hypothetical protein
MMIVQIQGERFTKFPVTGLFPGGRRSLKQPALRNPADDRSNDAGPRNPWLRRSHLRLSDQARCDA